MELLSSLSLYSRVMLGLCGALLLVILTEVLLLGGESDAAATASNSHAQNSAAPGAVPQRLQIPPVIAYREVTERPLFSDSRRPPPQAAAGNNATQATQLVGKWKVTGIVVAGDSSFALVEGIRDRKTVRLQLGTPLDGWQLEEIHPDHLVFNSADTTATLLLHNEEDGQSGRRR